MKIGYVALAGIAFLVGISSQHTDVAIERDWEYPTPDGNWIERQAQNAATIAALDGTEDLGEIITQLGQPDLEQSFGDTRLLMYRARRASDDYMTTPDETAVLVVRGTELVGVQQRADWFGGITADVDRTGWQDQQQRNRAAIERLRFGASKDEVLEGVGPADFVDQPLEGLEILAYRTRSVASDYETRRNETTSLLFEDGVFVGLAEGAPKSN